MFDRSSEEYPDSKSVDRIRSVPRGFDVKLETTRPFELSRLNLFFSLNSFIHLLRVVSSDITKVDNRQMNTVIFFHNLTFRVLIMSQFVSSGLVRLRDLCSVFNVADTSEQKQDL